MKKVDLIDVAIIENNNMPAILKQYFLADGNTPDKAIDNRKVKDWVVKALSQEIQLDAIEIKFLKGVFNDKFLIRNFLKYPELKKLVQDIPQMVSEFNVYPAVQEYGIHENISVKKIRDAISLDCFHEDGCKRFKHLKNAFADFMLMDFFSGSAAIMKVWQSQFEVYGLEWSDSHNDNMKAWQSFLKANLHYSEAIILLLALTDEEYHSWKIDEYGINSLVIVDEKFQLGTNEAHIKMPVATNSDASLFDLLALLAWTDDIYKDAKKKTSNYIKRLITADMFEVETGLYVPEFEKHLSEASLRSMSAEAASESRKSEAGCLVYFDGDIIQLSDRKTFGEIRVYKNCNPGFAKEAIGIIGKAFKKSTTARQRAFVVSLDDRRSEYGDLVDQVRKFEKEKEKGGGYTKEEKEMKKKLKQFSAELKSVQDGVRRFRHLNRARLQALCDNQQTKIVESVKAFQALSDEEVVYSRLSALDFESTLKSLVRITDSEDYKTFRRDYPNVSQVVIAFLSMIDLSRLDKETLARINFFKKPKFTDGGVSFCLMNNGLDDRDMVFLSFTKEVREVVFAIMRKEIKAELYAGALISRIANEITEKGEVFGLGLAETVEQIKRIFGPLRSVEFNSSNCEFAKVIFYIRNQELNRSIPDLLYLLCILDLKGLSEEKAVCLNTLNYRIRVDGIEFYDDGRHTFLPYKLNLSNMYPAVRWHTSKRSEKLNAIFKEIDSYIHFEDDHCSRQCNFFNIADKKLIPSNVARRLLGRFLPDSSLIESTVYLAAFNLEGMHCYDMAFRLVGRLPYSGETLDAILSLQYEVAGSTVREKLRIDSLLKKRFYSHDFLERLSARYSSTRAYKEASNFVDLINSCLITDHYPYHIFSRDDTFLMGVPSLSKTDFLSEEEAENVVKVLGWFPRGCFLCSDSRPIFRSIAKGIVLENKNKYRRNQDGLAVHYEKSATEINSEERIRYYKYEIRRRLIYWDRVIGLEISKDGILKVDEIFLLAISKQEKNGLRAIFKNLVQIIAKARSVELFGTIKPNPDSLKGFFREMMAYINYRLEIQDVRDPEILARFAKFDSVFLLWSDKPTFQARAKIKN